MVYAGVGSMQHEKAVVHHAEPYVHLGIALVSQFILEKDNLSIVKDRVIRAQLMKRYTLL